MDKKKDETEQANNLGRLPFAMGARPRTIMVDYDIYAHWLKEANWTEVQKREFLDAMWSVVVEFVMLGFEVHPAQQAQIACGKLRSTGANPAISRPDAVRSTYSNKGNFEGAARGETLSAAERIQE